MLGAGAAAKCLRRVPSRAAVAGRDRPRRRDDLLHFAAIAVAMEDEIAAGGERALRPFADLSAERPHRQIVGDEHAVEADLAADHLGSRARDNVAGAFGSIAM